MNKSKIKKAIYYAVTFFITLIIIINIFSIFNLSLFGFRIFKVASGSMRPYLNVGDVILVKKNKQYKEKDIITFEETKKAFVTNRVVSVDEDKITTRGDANNTNDKPISKEKVLGKVVCRFRIIPSILSKPITWCLLFVVGTLFVIIVPDKNES